MPIPSPFDYTVPQQTAGSLLREMRLSNLPGVKHGEFAARINVKPATYHSWENDGCQLDASKLGDIEREMDLSEEQTFALMYARLPALNNAWLAEQKVEKRAGYLLNAYRELKGMTQQGLAAAADISHVYFNRMEQGLKPITDKQIPRLAELLELDAEETAKFAAQAHQSNAAIREKLGVSCKSKPSTELGSTASAAQMHKTELAALFATALAGLASR